MKYFLIWVFNHFIKTGLVVGDPPAVLIKSDDTELIHYRSAYYRIINPHLIDQSYFGYLKHQFVFQNRLYRESDCLIQYPSGAVIARNKIVRESVLNTIGYVMRAGLCRDFCLNLFFPKRSKKLKKGFLLTGLMSYNFFHFLIDSLPRILDYLELKETERELMLVLNNPREFIFQYLELLGIKKENCLIIGENLKVSQLFISNHKYALADLKSRFPNFVYSRCTLLKMASLLYERARRNAPEFAGYQKIYVTRKDAGTRVLINEDEIFNILQSKGFVKVTLSDFAVAEQILLFANARVIVTVHGAGLANLIYAKNALVVEFFPCNKKLSTLYQMHQLGQISTNRHVLFVCNRVTPDQNVFVQPDLFVSVLDAELEKV